MDEKNQKNNSQKEASQAPLSVFKLTRSEQQTLLIDALRLELLNVTNAVLHGNYDHATDAAVKARKFLKDNGL